MIRRWRAFTYWGGVSLRPGAQGGQTSPKGECGGAILGTVSLSHAIPVKQPPGVEHYPCP
jgi:hypothetical protein